MITRFSIFVFVFTLSVVFLTLRSLAQPVLASPETIGNVYVVDITTNVIVDKGVSLFMYIQYGTLVATEQCTAGTVNSIVAVEVFPNYDGYRPNGIAPDNIRPECGPLDERAMGLYTATIAELMFHGNTVMPPDPLGKYANWEELEANVNQQWDTFAYQMCDYPGIYCTYAPLVGSNNSWNEYGDN
jgi:hypothetical protein